MLRLLNRRQQPTSASTTTTTITTNRTVLSPLDIPEILELIFSHLNDHTIRRSVVRVCRKWSLVNQHRLLRDEPKMHFDESVISALERLEVDYQRRLEKQRMRDSNTVKSDKKHLSTRTGTRTAATALYGFSPLREMVLFAAYCKVTNLNRFPFPSSLTRLTIQTRHSSYAQCDIGRILKMCPLLEDLCVESHEFGEQWTMLTVTATKPEHQDQSFPNLRSLVLVRVVFAQDDLESLLTLTPNLKELKLMGMAWHDSRNIKLRYIWTQLFGVLKANNITLDQAHFSNLGHRMSVEESHMLLTEVYPFSVRELSLWALDVTPRLFRSVFSQPEALTTLEIWWQPSMNDQPRAHSDPSLAVTHRLIQKYLCTCPQLARLTTLKVLIRVEDLDLFQRRGYTNLDKRQSATSNENHRDSPATNSSSASVWQCRGLQTLHIAFRMPSAFHAVYTRILFGFISRVCPALEDLQIWIPKQCHDVIYNARHSPKLKLPLRGGLCLLGRLQYLQRLRVVMDEWQKGLVVQEWELNWIVASGRKDAKSREKRQQEIESWRRWRANEDRIEKSRDETRQRQSSRNKPNIKSSNGSSTKSNLSMTDDAEILSRLQNLGLLLDVEDMMREMEVKETRPMPSLERISFNYPILLRPEEELERVFS
ncbi:hypothetical protein EC957_011159 [Mortierella hygrophila]|uniref:F-box domain-containing protein n=1 Tax=Mortierella hygrophila TaxID=979708 RepID=A0A9P6EWH2_9FUNG|nr:hypothetical protein EC957_011159 [Mortierella hygrophila]